MMDSSLVRQHPTTTCSRCWGPIPFAVCYSIISLLLGGADGLSSTSWTTNPSNPNFVTSLGFSATIESNQDTNSYFEITFPSSDYSMPVDVTLRQTGGLDATASWDGGTDTLTVLFNKAVSSGDVISFLATEVTLPNSIRGATTGSVSLYDSGHTKVEGPVDITIPAIVAGDLKKPATSDDFSFSKPYPGLPSVQFDMDILTNGGLPDGGTLVFEFPAGFSTTDLFVALSGEDSTGNVDYAWSDVSNELTVTIIQPIAQSANLHVRIEGMSTPSSFRAEEEFYVSAYYSAGVLISGPSTFTLPAITVGPISDLTFSHAVSTSGVVGNCIATFTVSGQVGVGGKLVLSLPQGDYTMSPTPTVTFASPADITTGDGEWDSGTGTLTVTLAASSSPIAASSEVVMEVFDVTSPPSVRFNQVGGVDTLDDSDGQIDTSDALVLGDIVAGTIVGSGWSQGTPLAGVTSYVSLGLDLSGRIPSGGSIELALPLNDFLMDTSPVVWFDSPSGVEGTGAWDAGDGVLVVTLSAGSELLEGSLVQLGIGDVEAPPSNRSLSSGLTVTTRAAADGGIIDGPSALPLLPIESGVLTGDLSLSHTLATPGVTASATLVFHTSGSVRGGGGGVVEVTLPPMWSVDVSSPSVTYVYDTSTPASECGIEAGAGEGSGVATGAWTNGDTAGLLVVTLDGGAGAGIPEDSCVFLTVSAVNTPSRVVGGLDGSVSTVATDGWVTDGPAPFIASALTPGELGGELAWTLPGHSPGITRNGTLVFGATGDIPQGGWIVVTFATGVLTILSPPRVVVEAVSPLGVAVSIEGDATWDAEAADGSQLSVKLSDGGVESGSSVKVLVEDVTTSASVWSAYVGGVETRDDTEGLIAQGEFNVVGAYAPGALGGALTWTHNISTPNMAGEVEVVFRSVGMIPQDGVIELMLPDDGWILDSSTPSVSFVSGDGGPVQSADAVWSADLRNLNVTVGGDGFAEASDIVFIVQGVRTPLSVRSTGIGLISTRTGGGGQIDGPSNLTVVAVDAGELVGGLNWTQDINTPAVTSQASLTFTPTGGVENGAFQVYLPPGDYVLPTNVSVEFLSPPGLVGVGRWDGGGNTVTVEVDGMLGSGVGVEVVLDDVRSPPSVRGGVNISMVTRDSTGGIVDETERLEVDAIVAGSLGGGQTFILGMNNPGVTTSATLNFTVSGAVGVDGSIVVNLPPGEFGLDPSPGTVVDALGVQVGNSNWNATSDCVTITVLPGGELGEGETVLWTVLGVQTPSGVRGEMSARVTTHAPWTGEGSGAGGLIDQSDGFTTSAVVAGGLGGELSWSLDQNVPGVTSNATVRLTGAGAIPLGGMVQMVLPTADYSMGVTPTIHFLNPASLSGTGAWDSDQDTLVVTLGVGVDAGVALEFVVVDVKSPASVRAEAVAVATTLDGDAGVIDGPTDVTISPITPGTITLVSPWDHTSSTPSVSGNASLTFLTSGELPVGSRCRFVLPDEGWGIDLDSPVVEFNSVLGGVSATWDGTSRNLDVLLGSPTSIPSGGRVSMIVQGVTTPPSVRGGSNLSLTTTLPPTPSSGDGEGGVVDGPTDLEMLPVVAGQLGGDLVWRQAVPTPGVTSDASLNFTIYSPVPAEGSLHVLLPVGDYNYHLGASEVGVELGSAVFLSPPGAAGVASWLGSGGELVITLDASTSLEVGDTVALVVGMMSPPAIRSVGEAEVLTKDELGVLIDGPNPVTVEEVTAGELTGSLLWSHADNSPGVTTDVTFQFITSAALFPGSSLWLSVPSGDYSMAPSPAVTFNQVFQAGLIGSATWSRSLNAFDILEITIEGEVGVGEGKMVEVEIAGVSTGCTLRSGTMGSVYTTFGGDEVTDGPNDVVIEDLVVGEMGSVEFKLDGVLEHLRGLVRQAVAMGVGLYEIFEYFDRDDIGEIDQHEFHKGMRKLGFSLTKHEARSLMDRFRPSFQPPTTSPFQDRGQGGGRGDDDPRDGRDSPSTTRSRSRSTSKHGGRGRGGVGGAKGRHGGGDESEEGGGGDQGRGGGGSGRPIKYRDFVRTVYPEVVGDDGRSGKRDQGGLVGKLRTELLRLSSLGSSSSTVFRVFDRDRDGWLDHREFRHALEDLVLEYADFIKFFEGYGGGAATSSSSRSLRPNNNPNSSSSRLRAGAGRGV